MHHARHPCPAQECNAALPTCTRAHSAAHVCCGDALGRVGCQRAHAPLGHSSSQLCVLPLAAVTAAAPPGAAPMPAFAALAALWPASLVVVILPVRAGQQRGRIIIACMRQCHAPRTRAYERGHDGTSALAAARAVAGGLLVLAACSPTPLQLLPLPLYTSATIPYHIRHGMPPGVQTANSSLNMTHTYVCMHTHAPDSEPACCHSSS